MVADHPLYGSEFSFRGHGALPILFTLPMELEESAYMEGAGFMRTYFSIILPQMKSAISVLVIYQFMSHWNEFSLALILITKMN